MRLFVWCWVPFISALAQSGGTFVTTGAPATNPGFGFSATLLANGKVLLAGGQGQYSEAVVAGRLGQESPGAELYDPSSGKFTRTGRLKTPRIGHAAVLLPDNSVLIAGGYGPADSSQPAVPLLDSAEVYDPESGQFTATASMTAVLRCPTGVLLPNGKALIVGGPTVRGQPPSAAPAEIYDPITRTFAASSGSHVSKKPTDSYYEACPTSLVLLPDGKVLVPWNEAEPEIYDPAADTFALAGTQFWENVRGGYGVSTTWTLLPSGKVLFAGGNGWYDDLDFTGFSNAWLYDESIGSFVETVNTNAPHQDHTATLLPDRSVLIAQGNKPELYEISSGTFSLTNAMKAPRYGHRATLLPDGSVLLLGGCCMETEVSAERYYPAVLTAAPVLLTIPGATNQAAILKAGTAQLVSSSNPASSSDVLEIYCTGLADGSVIPPQVTIGGRMAQVLWFGKAPGIAGLNQVNVRVPEGVPGGAAVPVRLHYLGRLSNSATIGLR